MKHEDKVILVTGGTGTFGNNFVDTILSRKLFRKIVILSRDEFKQFHMRTRLESTFDTETVRKHVTFIIGDIRDEARLETAFRGVHYVINAAALKHVPVCEYNPQEAVKTNVMGTMNVCSAASKVGVEKVIHLSTDKACEPINFYGSSKQLAEKYIVHSNNFSFGTKLSAVRYGNIIGSRGSIVETILRSAGNNNKINITDPEMTRFWLPVAESVEMVLWALDNMLGGEVIVPFAGSSNIIDLSSVLCEIIGKKFEYTITGTRPGEKIHEQLMARNEFDRAHISTCGKYTIILPESPTWSDTLIHSLKALHPNISKRTSFASSDKDFILNSDELTRLVRPYCNV